MWTLYRIAGLARSKMGLPSRGCRCNTRRFSPVTFNYSVHCFVYSSFPWLRSSALKYISPRSQWGHWATIL